MGSPEDKNGCEDYISQMSEVVERAKKENNPHFDEKNNLILFEVDDTTPDIIKNYKNNKNYCNHWYHYFFIYHFILTPHKNNKLLRMSRNLAQLQAQSFGNHMFH